MKQNYVPLDRTKHKDVKFTFDPTYSFAKETHIVALTVKEFGYAASALPIVFIKHPNQDTMYPAAMLGTEAGQNLFFQDEKWSSHYVPLNLQRWPFDIRQTSEDKFSVFIDENSEQFGTESGEALFDGEGNPTEYLENRRKLLEQITESEFLTPRLIKQLADLDLFTPAAVRIAYASGEQKNMVGMFVIDEKKVQQLDDESVLQLHKSGALAMIYATLTSLSQLNRLMHLSQSTDKPIVAMQMGPDAQAEGEAAKQEEKAEA